MPKGQTEKSRYPSRYSPQKFVTAAQYILELVCEKRALKDKKELPIKFWNLPEWASLFKSQLRKCHALLKQYDEKAIIAAIKGSNIYSLHAPWITQECDKHQGILEAQKRKREMEKAQKTTKHSEPEPDTISTKREPRVERNARSKLFELDDID